MADLEPKIEAAAAPNVASAASGGSAKSASVRKGLLTFGGFRTLFAGSLAGTLADRLYQMALIASANLIFIGHESEVNTTWVQLVGTIPGVFLFAAASSLIDSYDRRRLMSLVEAIKVVFVLMLVPLLWHASSVDSDSVLRDQLVQYWPYCLAVVFILNVINIPFSPARAAAIPDVLPDYHRSIGASLMATSGLISLLLGTALGGILARRDVLGPAKMIILSSGLFLISSLILSRLPVEVTVPGNRRQSTEEVPPEAKEGFGGYMSGLAEGFRYCLRHPSVLGLSLFETTFWAIASAFNFLFQVYLRTALEMKNADDKTTFFGLGLGCAGLGLFGGALGIGKICRRVSPIMTYAPAFSFMAIGLMGVFSAHLENGHPPWWIYPMMFFLGLGGGLVLGRVDADVLTTTPENVRGRVFSFKAMLYAITTLLTMYGISKYIDDSNAPLAFLWLPRIIFIFVPIAFIFSWIIDIAIWSKRGDTELPGPLHRLGYRFLRAMFRFFFIVLFRYESKGRENVPKTGPVVLAANHASFIDPMLLGCATDRPVQYIIYSTYYRSFAHPIFRFLRCIPVDEKDNLGALKAGVRSLNQGACIGIFPEGRVTADGQLNPPMRGALFMAQRAGAMVVPVALKGNFAAFPRSAKLPRMSKIMPIVGQPFAVSKDLSKKEMAELTDKLMADLARELELKPPPTTADKIQ